MLGVVKTHCRATLAGPVAAARCCCEATARACWSWVRDPTTWTILQQDGPNHLMFTSYLLLTQLPAVRSAAAACISAAATAVEDRWCAGGSVSESSAACGFDGLVIRRCTGGQCGGRSPRHGGSSGCHRGGRAGRQLGHHDGPWPDRHVGRGCVRAGYDCIQGGQERGVQDQAEGRGRRGDACLCRDSTPQHGLPSNTMALMTSDCGTMRSPSIKWP